MPGEVHSAHDASLGQNQNSLNSRPAHRLLGAFDPAQAAGKALAERADEQKVGIDPDHIEFFNAEAF